MVFNIDKKEDEKIEMKTMQSFHMTIYEENVEIEESRRLFFIFFYKFISDERNQKLNFAINRERMMQQKKKKNFILSVLFYCAPLNYRYLVFCSLLSLSIAKLFFLVLKNNRNRNS